MYINVEDMNKVRKVIHKDIHKVRCIYTYAQAFALMNLVNNG